MLPLNFNMRVATNFQGAEIPRRGVIRNVTINRQIIQKLITLCTFYFILYVNIK